MLFVIICCHIGLVVGVILLIIALKEKLEKKKAAEISKDAQQEIKPVIETELKPAETENKSIAEQESKQET